VRADIVITLESPDQPDVIRLLDALDDYLLSLYPVEINHILDVKALSAPDIAFFVARIDGRAVGCGAVKRHAEGYAEIKRVYTHPDARGKGVATQILGRIEAHAHARGLNCVRLETGIRQREALNLYRRAGYVDRGPFADYSGGPLSVFLEKTLAPHL
jgi:putative acetyltransferase